MLHKRGRSLSAILVSMALTAAASCYSNGGNSYPTGPGTGGVPGELNSGNLGPGATFQHRFATAGTFNYHCIYHAPMTGSVVVSAAATDTVMSVNITSSTMRFPTASVKPGGRVVWTNNTTEIHTVTSD